MFGAHGNPAAKEDGRTPNVWFAIGSDRPLAFFAGVWLRDWECVRKVKDGLIRCDLFGFLTTEPNGAVAPSEHAEVAPMPTTVRG